MLQLGKEQTVTVDGKAWKLGRLELSIVNDFRDWIAERLPDPLAIGEKFFAMLPPDEQLARVRQAEQQKLDLACFTLKSPLAVEYMSREAGIAKLGQLLLRKHQPNVTEAEAFDVFFALQDQMGELLAKAEGKSPPSGNAGALAG